MRDLVDILILVLGIAIGVLIGYVWGASKTFSEVRQEALSHGCAEMAPDTTHKIFQWKEPTP